MIVVGLTGAIGMGKSATANMFRQFGFAIFNADQEVRRLRQSDAGVIKALKKAFPHCITKGTVDVQKLTKSVLQNPEEIQTLEAIYHPLVHAAIATFLQEASALKLKGVILDIPLLFEGGLHEICTHTVCVTAPTFVQCARVMARAGMTKALFEHFRAFQMSDGDKKDLADFVIFTGLGRRYTLFQVQTLTKALYA